MKPTTLRTALFLPVFACVVMIAVVLSGCFFQKAYASDDPVFVPYPAANEASTSNLVLVVRFPGDTSEGFNAQLPDSYLGNADGVVTKAQYLVRKFNAPDNSGYVKGSFRWYFRQVSGGKCDPISVFPQLSDEGQFVYLDLPSSAEVYLSDYVNGHDTTLLNDISECFKQFLKSSGFDMSLADRNNDGVVDNLTIIPQVSQNVFVSHKGDAYTQELGNKTIGTYTLIDTGLVQYNDISVASHEYMHTLGAVDLYRNASSGNPVGYWDIMGRGGSQSWPLAITRQRVGWIGALPEIDHRDAALAGGVYETTLHTAYSTDDKGNALNQAVVLKSPLNDSEYFVVEYREKGNKYNAAGLDGWIGGSGVVIYRVNPAFEEHGNIAGDDYVYVFRSGETSLYASEGDETNAQLGTTQFNAPRSSLGSADLNADFSDGTIFYSDGRNSGITVSVTNQTNGSATIQVSFADYESVDLWNPLNGAAQELSPDGTSADAVQCVSCDGALYVLIQDGGAKVYSYDFASKAWSKVGSDVSGLLEASLQICDGKPMLLGTNTSYNTIKAYVFENGSWTLRASKSAYINSFAAGAGCASSQTGDTIYVFADADNQVYRLSGNQFVAVGSALSLGYATSPCFFGVGGKDYLLCCDFFSNKSLLYEIKANQCVQVASISHGVKVPQAVVVDDVAYVFACNSSDGYAPSLLSFDGKSLIETQYPDFSDVGAGVGLATDGTLLYLALAETSEENSPVNVYTAFPDTAIKSTGIDVWTRLGASVCTSSYDASLAIIDGMVCCGCYGTDGKAMLRAHESVNTESILQDGKPLDNILIQLPRDFDISTCDKVDLRFAFALDSLNYKSAGLLFAMGSLNDASMKIGNTGVKSYTARAAYSSVIVDGVLTPVTEALGTNRTLAIAVKMTGIPKQVFSSTISVRGFVEKNNGSIVYGPVRKFSVNAL